MRLKAITLCLMAGFCTSANAQDSTQKLELALKQMPQALLSSPQAMQVFFLDVQAWKGLEKSTPSVEAMRRLVLSQSLRPLESLGYGVAEWSDKAKVSLDELSYFAGFGQSPATVTYWGLSNEQAVQSLTAALKQTDFVPVEGGTSGLLANGEANKIDFTKRDPQSPWRGATGATSFILPVNDVVIQASSDSTAITSSQSQPSIADSEVIKAALSGLKDAIPSKDGHIIQAAIISPLMGLNDIDPIKILPSSPSDIETAKQNFKANIETGRQGIAPYFGGVIADVQMNNAPAMVISLSYADCATAKQAAEGITAAWQKSMAATVEGKTSYNIVQSGALCAATFSITAPSTKSSANPILSQMMNLYMQRNFTVLQIGSSN